MTVYVGTSGYSYDEWKGEFYPERLSSKKMLEYYAQRLNTVEINNTFYHMPVQRVLASWASQVPDDFVFALKAPQLITHFKQLINVNEPTEYLFATLSTLGSRLGPVLFQFPKTFRIDVQALQSFLQLIPPDVHCAFAFRNPASLVPEVLDLLRDIRCSVCQEDTDEQPVTDIISTAAWGYLRLRRSDYSDADLSEWARRIAAQEWEEAFVYFKHENEARSPLWAVRFRHLDAE